MYRIPHSGLYYPNKFALLSLMAFEEIVGKQGLHAILNLAGLSQFVNNYPPDNLTREFDFAHFSAIHGALTYMYGEQGARGLSLRIGQTIFNDGLRNFGILAGVSDLSFKILPLKTKLKISLLAMAKVFSTTSDQFSTVHDSGDHYIYTMHKCPVCWGRTSEKPCCYIAIGLLQGALKWVSQGYEFKVVQTTCHATGDNNCQIAIYKDPISIPK